MVFDDVILCNYVCSLIFIIIYVIYLPKYALRIYIYIYYVYFHASISYQPLQLSASFNFVQNFLDFVAYENPRLGLGSRFLRCLGTAQLYGRHYKKISTNEWRAAAAMRCMVDICLGHRISGDLPICPQRHHPWAEERSELSQKGSDEDGDRAYMAG